MEQNYYAIEKNKIYADYENPHNDDVYNEIRSRYPVDYAYVQETSNGDLISIYTCLTYKKVDNVYYCEETGMFFYSSNLVPTTAGNIARAYKSINLKTVDYLVQILKNTKGKDDEYVGKKIMQFILNNKDYTL